jgi:outer membrane protein
MRFFTFLISFFAIFNLNGQDNWTLQDCVAFALEHNLNIIDSDLNIDAIDVDLKQAKHAMLPNLSASVNSGWNFGRTIDPTTNTFNTRTFFNNGYSLSSNVTLFDGGRVRNSIKQSQANKNIAGYNLEQIKRDITLGVATEYLNTLFAIENLKIAENQLNNTENQLEQLNKSINAGVRPKNDALNVQAQEASDQQNLVNAQNAYDQAALNLKQLMRLDPSIKIKLVVPENINNLLDPDKLSFEELYSSAYNFDPNIKAAQEELISSNLGEKIAKSALTPSLFLGGTLSTNYSNQGKTILGYDTERINQTFFFDGNEVMIGQDVEIPRIADQAYQDQLDQNLGYGFGLQLSIPIYQNYVNRGNLQKARIRTKSNLNNFEREKDALKTKMYQALALAKAAKAALRASEKTFNARNITYQNAIKSFDIGAINSYELINLKNLMNTAELNLVNAKYEYLFRTKILDFYLGKPINIE